MRTLFLAFQFDHFNNQCMYFKGGIKLISAAVQGVCHWDLKLENLLLEGNPPVLKICDFGYSKVLHTAARAVISCGHHLWRCHKCAMWHVTLPMDE